MLRTNMLSLHAQIVERLNARRRLAQCALCGTYAIVITHAHTYSRFAPNLSTSSEHCAAIALASAASRRATLSCRSHSRNCARACACMYVSVYVCVSLYTCRA
jgi:hypothetical protein